MHRLIRKAAILTAAALSLAACSHGSGSSGAEQAPTAPAAGIVIGLINTEDAPVGSFPELRRGAVVAEHYVNDTLHGIAGKPIKLVTCTTTGTPESSQACANQLLAAHPVAVIGGVDLGAAASLPPLQNNHIPYVGGTPAATDPLTSGGSYMLTGGTATEVLGEVGYAADTLHVTNLAVVYSDVPGLLSQAATLLTSIVRKKGVSQFKLFPVEGNTPDVVPVLSAVAARHPQAVIAVFPAQDCGRIIQGVAAVGLKTTMMYPSFCGSQSVISAAGSSLNGSIIASGYLPFTDTSDADVATYLAAVHTYDAGLEPSLLSQAGFSDVVVLQHVLAGIKGPVTAAAVSAAFKATNQRPGFMSHAFTCDGKQIPLLPGLCNTFTQISIVDSGRLKPVGSWIDTGPIARLVG
ncbi:MAG TPA: ABC transporter substrate-binding protein [Mycobacteriales bacterium]|nr:ABC transporter substrate-binding protein [Mycobacteriales bacterium]